VGKKIKEEIERIKGIFVEKAAEFRGYKNETTTYVYEKMVEPAALYSFNKSHAVAYAMISFQTAYLKANYPLEFYAALLRSVEDDTDKLSKFINEVLYHGMRVKVPSVNESFNHIAAIDDYIRLGFFCVKGVGSDVGESIQAARSAGGPFSSLQDFLLRCEKVVNKKSLESLIKAGAFDEFGERAMLLENVQQMIDRVKHAPASSAGLFGEQMRSDLVLKQVPAAGKMQTLLMEYDAFKSFVSGHPFDGLYQYLKKYNFLSTMLASENFGPFKMVCYIKDIQRAKKKGFFILVEDISAQREIFFKEVLDFHKFDILIVYGYKAKSFRIQKIIKTSLDKLIHDAQRAGKYRPEEDVRMIKEIR
jgi:DNA polymerase III alpha subunit